MENLPVYKCHKEVRALKINAVEFEKDGSAKIAGKDFGTYQTLPGFRIRFKGNEDDLGYLVVYSDGYESWSPTKAFEDGYSLKG